MAGELYVGGDSVSITPDQPVALSGQMRTRIAREVESEVTATALALETRDGDRSLDQAIMVSCDLVAIREGIVDMVRQRIKDRIPDFDADKLVLSATHTHTAPVMRQDAYDLPQQGIMQPEAYVEFLSDRVAEAAVNAWQSRKAGPRRLGIGTRRRGSESSQRVRRRTRADVRQHQRGRLPRNRGLPGPWRGGVVLLERAAAAARHGDQRGLSLLRKLRAVRWSTPTSGIPFASRCKPSTESSCWCSPGQGASGDQSPHLMYRKRAEERMRKLRGVSRLEEIARRIVDAWEEGA